MRNFIYILTLFLTLSQWSYSQNEYSSIDWIKTFGVHSSYSTSGAVYIRDMAIDSENNIYQVGVFNFNANFVDFSTDNIVSSRGSGDGYIAKYDSEGNILWKKTFGSIYSDEAKVIEVLSDGNILVGGGFLGTAEFSDGSTSTSIWGNNSTNPFLMKMDKDNGDIIWKSTFDSEFSYGTIFKIKELSDGKIAVLKLYGSGGYRIAIIDIANNNWSVSAIISNGSSGALLDMEVDEDDNIYISGSATDALNYDGEQKVTLGGTCGYGLIFKINKDLNFKWVTAFDKKCTHISTITYDKFKKRLYASGLYTAETNFNPNGDPLVLTPHQIEWSSFLASYKLDGIVDWVHEFEGSNLQNGRTAISFINYDSISKKLIVKGDKYNNQNDNSTFDIDLTSDTILTGTRQSFIGIYDENYKLYELIEFDQDNSNGNPRLFLNNNGNLIFGDRNPPKNNFLGINPSDGGGEYSLSMISSISFTKPIVTLSSSNYLPEDDKSMKIKAHLSRTMFSDVTINLSFSGNATGSGIDYNVDSTSIIIPAGQTSGFVTITSIKDEIVEDDETVIIEILSIDNAYEETDQKITVNITEDICLHTNSNLSGVISSDKKLYKSCSPYTVTDNLLVKEGASLVIEPGVIVQVSPEKFIRVEGNIKAIGSESDSIEFKSTSSERWEGIKIRSAGCCVAYTQENYTPDSEFKYVKFSGYDKALYVWDSGVKVDHSKFTGIYGVADYAMEIIRVEGVTINNSIFENHNTAITTKSGYSNEDDLGHLFSVHIKNSTFKNNDYGLNLPLNQKGMVDFQLTGNKFISNDHAFSIYGGTYGARIIKNNISNNIFYNNNLAMYFLNIQATCNTNDMYSCGMDSRLIAKYGLTDDEYPLRINNNIIVNTKEVQNHEVIFMNGHLSSNGKTDFSNNIIISPRAGIHIDGRNSPGTVIKNNYFDTGWGALNLRKDPSYDSYSAKKVTFSENTLSLKNEDNFSTDYNDFYLRLSEDENIISYNNFPKDDSIVYNNSKYDNKAENNYWGTTTESEIQDAIYDYNDDFDLGEVDYTPFATSPNINAPISPPKNVKITRLANSVELSWDANTESDVAGYKLHYGTFTGYSYSNVLDLGNVTSKTLNVGLGVTDGITLTAYDSDADGTDDQIEGHESWFAEAEVVSAPIGVNDSYQIAAGSSLDITIGPFAHYQFDKDNDLTGAEDNQRVKDVSGNGYDLGASYLSNRFVNDRFDKENQALKFEGTSMVSYQHDDAFNFKGQNEWSIYLWMKIDNKGSNQWFNNNTILSKITSSPQTCCGWRVEESVRLEDPGHVSNIHFWILKEQVSGEQYDLSYDYIAKNETEWDSYIPIWHQVAITYNGSEFSMFFDGVKVKSIEASQPDISDSNASLIIAEKLYGNLDDIRFYNRALTALEIQDMYTETNVQSFAGVLANDIDLDGDTLTATLVQTTTNGTLTLQDNGKFKYVPNASYSGNDNFTYKAFDGTYSSANTIANISVSTPPTALNDSYSVDEDAVLTVDIASGVLSNDADAENDAMTAVKLTDPTHGTLTFNADGSFTYDHDGGASTSDSFTYQASDGIGNSNTATVTITIVASDDAPVANPDAYGTEQDQVLNITKEEGVLKNDVDEEGDAMTVELVADVTLGTLTLDADGSFNYTPPIGQMGIDTFRYKVKAAELFSNTTYATININGRPVISDGQVFNVDENKSNGYTVGQISIVDESSTFTWEILSGNQDNIFSIESNGSIKVNNSSALNYEQIQHVTLNLRAHDGSMWSDPKDVNININNVQDMAIISSEVTHSYCSSGTGTGSITLVVEGEEGDLDISWSNGEQNTLSINNLSSGTYSVTLTDDVGQTISENYTINLLPIYPNTAVCYVTSDADDYTRNRIVIKTGDAYYNVDKYRIYREGSVEGDYDKIGEIDADVDDNFLDTQVDNRTQSFKYKVSMVDSCGVESNLSTEHITHHLISNQGIGGEINLSWTDYVGVDFSSWIIYKKINAADFVDIGRVSRSVRSFSDFAVTSSNNYKYYVAADVETECRPEGGEAFYIGDDDIGYGIGQGGKKKVNLRSNTFELEGVNTLPVANDITETTNKNIAKDIILSATDADGDTLIYSIVAQPLNGSVTLAGDTATYTPNNNFVGNDNFTYKANDGKDDSNVATVIVTVTDVNNPPVANDLTMTTDKNLPNDVTLSATDADNDLLTYSIVAQPLNGSVTLSGSTATYMPNNNFVGNDNFTYKANDGKDDSNVATVIVTVTDVGVLGLEDISSEIFNVYPIPAQNKLKVVFKENVMVKNVEFVDFSGIVYTPNHVKMRNRTLTIDISNIHSGVYILNLVSENTTSRFRIFIER